METVWTQFIDTGRSELVLGCRSKNFVLPPAPGQQAPNQITLIQRYMNFHIRYMGVAQIHSHATITNLDKWVEISMVDLETLPCNTR